ncbi:MAG: Cation-transporting ATPase PacS [Planctomycetota bacterium]
MNGAASNLVCCAWCGLPIPGLSVELVSAEPECAVGAQKVVGSTRSADEYCCYGCRFAHAVVQEKGEPGAVRWTVVRLGLSIFFSMNLMAFTMTMWSLDVYEVQRDPLQQQLFDVFRWLSLVLSVPVFLLLGIPLVQNALTSRRRGMLATDLLIVSGVAAAYGVSIVAVLRGSEKVYFEVGAAVLVMVTLGRWLEAAGRQKATEVLDQLAALLPATVRRITASGVHECAAAEIVAGDCLQIRPGDRFPVDGVLSEGVTTVDEQVFTGESEPVLRGLGDGVLAGTVNLDGAVVLRAAGGLRSGSFAGLLAVLQEARLSRGVYQRLAERVTRWFLPLVSVTAVLSVVWHWNGIGGPGAAIQAGLSVLLIACPCALGLATPLAVWTALSTAARRHVLFRSGESIERLAGIDAVCFDKTGTLTTGHPEVSAVRALAEGSDEPLLRELRQLATYSTHPCSRAIAESADLPVAQGTSQGGVGHGLTDVKSVPGFGMEARDAAGRLLRLGSLEFAGGAGCGVDRIVQERIEEALAAADRTGALLTIGAVDSVPMFAFVLTETLREGACAAVADCLQEGLRVRVLTGDRALRAEQLGRQLRESCGTAARHGAAEVQVLSGLRPEDKVGVLQRMRAAGESVAMVGDGINDAPALAACDVGIALGCGADVSRNSADVCLLSNDLSRIAWAVRLSRRTTQVIRRNLFWAFGYNTAGVAVAACGWLNPALSAALMIVSSVLVISNSLTLMRDVEGAAGEGLSGAGDVELMGGACAAAVPGQSAPALQAEVAA